MAATSCDADISERFEIVESPGITDQDFRRSLYFSAFMNACDAAWKMVSERIPIEPDWLSARVRYAASKLSMTEREFGGELRTRVDEAEFHWATAAANSRRPIKDGSYGRMQEAGRWVALAAPYGA